MTKFKRNFDKLSNSAKHNDATSQLHDNWTFDVCVDGLYGRFKTLDSDYIRKNDEIDPEPCACFSDEPHWPSEKREKVRKFRFVIATMVLSAIALSLTSRMILNIAVVEMVKTDTLLDDILTTTSNPATNENSTLISNLGGLQNDIASRLTQLDSTTISTEAPEESEEEDDPNDLHFNWSSNQVNTLLGSFYIGYSPAILFSGSLVNRFGSRYPLLAVILGSAILNMLTPFIARFSYGALVLSRIIMGLAQGSVVPCAYDVFNKWLTRTEASIFVPLIKVSMPMGSLIGTALPFLMTHFGYEWPFLFYSGSFICIIWSIVWIFLSSSTPQESKFVDSNELNRIMRKKIVALPKQEIATIDNKNINGHPKQGSMIANGDRATVKMLEATEGKVGGSPVAVAKKPQQPTSTKSNSIPWRLIIFNPSVIALTIVKYTYNLGMDFFYLELAVYLRGMHNAPIETISMIASSGYFMQMTLITIVGWISKNLVNRRAFGLSVTKWRKIFQGTSNLGMASIYFMFPYLSSDLTSTGILILTIWFFWMLGAGGESLVPYDLSTNHPAAIVGLAHGLSIFSGLSVPGLCTLVLGSETDSEAGWNILFMIIGSLLTFGGLVFICVLKAKPFLPEERIPKQVVVVAQDKNQKR